ncbi:hypothetical protein LKO27_10765 [Tessaracoccus sp. OS52]|uniref:hypothetical protein n=1 Tax=Tessaracoccus sp. OS52 TaxID=2886691 RepID=UPI001D1196A0|nr:hypothetical protein [Tessaracoccus sp. OS52]MCC2593886.1 hypothetical protein [Tessaracoccus sp. OS52]
MHIARVTPTRRALHLVGDLVLIGWAIMWGLIAWTIKGAVDLLAVPSESIGATTRDLAGEVDGLGDRIREVPFVGEELQGGFTGIGDALRGLATDAAAQADAIHGTAWLLFWFAFAMPTLTLALIYLPPRIRRGRESAAARAYIDQLADLDLFALRAMAKAPMTQLAKISDDPVAAWRRGDAAVISRMANLELKRSGIAVVEVEGPPNGNDTPWGTKGFR